MTHGTRRIHDARVRPLNERAPVRGRCVLYWMQQSQRAAGNHALEFAVQRANALGLPLRVGFGLTDAYPEAAERHYRFMLEGLRQTARDLAARGIPLVVRRGAPEVVALQLASDVAEVVCDRGYLRHQKRWRRAVAASAACPVIQVESDVVVPVAVALALNNRYLLDGRDPASYANVGWIFGLHDRPWPQRPIYGTVRSMAASGLRRKSDIDAYVAAVDVAVAEAQRRGVRYDDPPGPAESRTPR